MSWTVSVICVKDVKINWWTVANLKWNLSNSLCLQFNLFRVAKCWSALETITIVPILVFLGAHWKKMKKKQFVAVTFTPIMVIILHAFRIGRKGKKYNTDEFWWLRNSMVCWIIQIKSAWFGLVGFFFSTFQIISIAKTNANWIVFMTPSCARQ